MDSGDVSRVDRGFTALLLTKIRDARPIPRRRAPRGLTAFLAFLRAPRCFGASSAKISTGIALSSAQHTMAGSQPARQVSLKRSERKAEYSDRA